jgi:Kef-type K+ transport system membrane component KefB
MHGTHMLPSPVVSATLARNVVLIACAASAVVHAALVPSHLDENLWLGIALAASVALLLALVVSLARLGDPRRRAAPAAAVLAVLIVAYSLSRTVGLAPLEEHVEPVDAIGLLTQGVQAAGLVAALLLCHPSGGATARLPEGIPHETR